MSRSTAPALRVLMVCMGNICRSPTAEAVLRHRLRASGLGHAVEVDSAGTHAWHTRDAPDARSTRHASKRGYDLSALRARPVGDADFARFDLILAMDADNLAWLEERCPEPHRGKLMLLGAHHVRLRSEAVPDPYSGSEADFEHVLDLVEDACEGLVGHLRTRLAAGPGGAC
jgi:protein-tyrosine phosphatase